MGMCGKGCGSMFHHHRHFKEHNVHLDDSSDSVVKLSIDVPGVKATDLSVNVEENDHTGHHILVVSGVRQFASAKQDSQPFVRRFALNTTIDDAANQIKANLSDGVLVITVPKQQENEQINTTSITVPITTSTDVTDAEVAGSNDDVMEEANVMVEGLVLVDKVNAPAEQIASPQGKEANRESTTESSGPTKNANKETNDGNQDDFEMVDGVTDGV